ncbi:ester cyclase [Kocuria coralli]|uniref:Ester cyclase n=1 Tax=Kocuria coralli TaxID=1461025 RepID=A0A5J5KWE4_9MICC|nr:ester cyclase [Kocuria coralli]KAA9393215.1 ester cyclase [Kocuria coralli]
MTTTTATTNLSRSANAALPAAHAVFEAINSKDLSCLTEAVTSDFVDHGSPFPLPPGPEGYRQILTYVTQVLSIRYELKDQIVTGDRIVFRAVAYGTSVAAVQGEEFAGRPYSMDTIHIYRTEGDRLAEHWGVRNELGVLQQIGALPMPVQPE